MEISGKSFHINLSIELMGTRLLAKFLGAGYRVLSFFKNTPVRLSRILTHLWKGLLFMRPRRLPWWKSNSDSGLIIRIVNWWIDLLLYLGDLFGLSELYEILMDFIKFNSRSLYNWEIELAKSVFGNSIDYKRVRIDQFSISGPKQMKFCYVSFYIINSWGPMQNSTFIHELTHIWQFEKMGSVYIPRALRAQQSPLGYDYGGISALKTCQEKGKSFLSFNFEQQGDIISDYYRIRDGYRPQWGNGTRMDLPVYESFIDQVRNS